MEGYGPGSVKIITDPDPGGPKSKSCGSYGSVSGPLQITNAKLKLLPILRIGIRKKVPVHTAIYRTVKQCQTYIKTRDIKETPQKIMADGYPYPQHKTNHTSTWDSRHYTPSTISQIVSKGNSVCT